MIFISEIMSIINQKNTLRTYKKCVIYSCPNCVIVLPKNAQFLFYFIFFWWGEGRLLLKCFLTHEGAHIKYVGGGRVFTNFSKKNKFVAQETIDLNISWTSNFFGKYFKGPSINFSFLFKVLPVAVFKGSTQSNIQISNQ